jgi:hypothetical protein
MSTEQSQNQPKGLKARMLEKQKKVYKNEEYHSKPVNNRPLNVSSPSKTHIEPQISLTDNQTFPSLNIKSTSEQSLGAWGNGIDTIRNAVNIPAPIILKKQAIVVQPKQVIEDDRLECSSAEEDASMIDDEWNNI